jgi:hypothetical protein
MMTENLSVLQPVETALSVPTPAQFSASLAEAQAKAQSLKAMISANKWSVDIRGSEHIRVEAWITLASGYGCTAQIVEGSVRRLEGYDSAFEARAEVLRSTPTGTVVIGAAEAECGTEGDGIWEHDQAAYAVRSMAQTRAISKAISSVFRWVVVLAGYSGTPFEDMPRGGGASFENRAPVQGNPRPANPRPASQSQISYLLKLGYDGTNEEVEGLTSTKASILISDLVAAKEAKEAKGPQDTEAQDAEAQDRLKTRQDAEAKEMFSGA